HAQLLPLTGIAGALVIPHHLFGKPGQAQCFCQGPADQAQTNDGQSPNLGLLETKRGLCHMGVLSAKSYGHTTSARAFRKISFSCSVPMETRRWLGMP